MPHCRRPRKPAAVIRDDLLNQVVEALRGYSPVHSLPEAPPFSVVRPHLLRLHSESIFADLLPLCRWDTPCAHAPPRDRRLHLYCCIVPLSITDKLCLQIETDRFLHGDNVGEIAERQELGPAGAFAA